jgi:sorbitol/mannitol transport system permease protein
MTMTDTSPQAGRTGPAGPKKHRPPSARQQLKAEKRATTAKQRLIRRLPLLPALILTIVVTQLPFVVTLYYSTLDWNLLHPEDGKKFIGLSNYTEAFTDSTFRDAAFNTVVITASAVIISMLFGVGCAMLLDRKFLGRGVVRTLLISPFLVMPIAAALLWKYGVYNPVFGLLNAPAAIFDAQPTDWVSKFPVAAIVSVLVWQWTPFMTLIVLAGLQSQSLETMEAARVDGAGPWQAFRWITFPHLRQYIELGLLLGSIYLVQTFDAIFTITQGGPGTATTNLPYFLYLEAFRAFDIGQAAALGVVVVIATIIVSTFALRVISSLFKGTEAHS